MFSQQKRNLGQNGGELQNKTKQRKTKHVTILICTESFVNMSVKLDTRETDWLLESVMIVFVFPYLLIFIRKSQFSDELMQCPVD